MSNNLVFKLGGDLVGKFATMKLKKEMERLKKNS